MPLSATLSPEIYTQPVPLLQMEPGKRLPYAPTPLSPSSLLTADNVPYSDASMDKIGGLVEPYKEQFPEWLVTAVHEILIQAHWLRCYQNNDVLEQRPSLLSGEGLEPASRALLRRALVGAADPAELLRLKRNVHQLGGCAIELAKQSHPFSWHTGDMADAVGASIDNYDQKTEYPMRYPNPRYAYWRVDADTLPEARALIVVRKRDVTVLGRSRHTAVIKRSTFALRIDDGITTPDELKTIGDRLTGKRGAWFKNEDGVSQALANMGEEVEEGIRTQAAWMVPITTSYYCRDTEGSQSSKLERKTFYPARLGSEFIRLVT